MNEDGAAQPLSRVISGWTAERWVTELRLKVARSRALEVEDRTPVQPD